MMQHVRTFEARQPQIVRADSMLSSSWPAAEGTQQGTVPQWGLADKMLGQKITNVFI